MLFLFKIKNYIQNVYIRMNMLLLKLIVYDVLMVINEKNEKSKIRLKIFYFEWLVEVLKIKNEVGQFGEEIKKVKL